VQNSHQCAIEIGLTTVVREYLRMRHAHQQISVTPGLLRQCAEHSRRGRLIQRGVFAVLDDSYDSVFPRASVLKKLADGRPFAEQLLCKGLIDNRYLWRLFVICPGERAACQQPRFRGLEISGRHRKVLRKERPILRTKVDNA
jgi:hypothetical protein